MRGLKIGLGGGVFDPVHFGHLFLFNECAHKLALDKVLIIPTYSAVHKDTGGITEYHYRREMVDIVCQTNEQFEVSDIEKELGGDSYSIHTIRALKEKYPGNDWYFLAGMDNLRKMEEWYHPEEIVKETTVVIGSRPVEDWPGRASFYDTVRFVDMPQLEISSTDIRRRVASGESIRYLVPRAVEEYIIENGLYKNQTK